MSLVQCCEDYDAGGGLTLSAVWDRFLRLRTFQGNYCNVCAQAPLLFVSIAVSRLLRDITTSPELAV